ncbi:hypothetical protein CQ022_07940 [Chryseobacterium culicis]|nr:hypothetical protein CQ022_07940 [Chryseobacterium culicis]
MKGVEPLRKSLQRLIEVAGGTSEEGKAVLRNIFVKKITYFLMQKMKRFTSMTASNNFSFKNLIVIKNQMFLNSTRHAVASRKYFCIYQSNLHTNRSDFYHRPIRGKKQ